MFATKNREKRLTAAVRTRLHAYLTALVKAEGGCAHIVNGGLEHVHLLVRLAPSQALADLMRKLKTNSSGWMRRELDPHFAWQRGYSAFSVSHSQLTVVWDYIARQEEHHRRRTFEDELVSLLKRNEIDSDEKRLWEPLQGAE